MAERFARVTKLLKEKQRVMEYIANRLLEKEIIEQSEFKMHLAQNMKLERKS